MIKKLNYLYWEIRYRWLKHRWDKANKYSIINGVALMYHHVCNEHIETNDSCQCSVEQFKDVIDAIKQEGRKFVSCDIMMDIIAGKDKTPFAVVTFDDVPDNFYSNAYPILKERSIPFILFITTGFVGKPGYLSEEQIIYLDKDPLCTIGAHTLTHPMLRRVKNINEELIKSKQILEESLGHKVNYMAYPFGRQSSVSKKVMKEAEKAGYLCAFGTIQSLITDISTKNLFYIPRIVRK